MSLKAKKKVPRFIYLAFVLVFIFFIIFVGAITITDVSSADSILINVTAENNFTHLSIGNLGFINESNLVMYFPFDTNTSQTTIYDYTATGADGTIAGNSNYNASGWVGGGFDARDPGGTTGDGGSVIPNVANIDVGTYTASVWFRKRADPSNQGFLYHASVSGGTTEAIGMYIEASGDFRVFSDGGGGVDCTGTAKAVGEWHHFAVTQNSSTIEAFVDGVSCGTDTSFTPQSGSIGSQHFFSGRTVITNRGFNGTIDEFMLINTTLTAPQIADIYANQSSRFFATGSQEFPNNNVSVSGSENRINITIESNELFDSNLKVTVGDESGGSYSFGSEFSFTNNFVEGIPVSTPNNISIKFLFNAGNSSTNSFITPNLINDVLINGYEFVVVQTNTTINITEDIGIGQTSTTPQELKRTFTTLITKDYLSSTTSTLVRLISAIIDFINSIISTEEGPLVTTFNLTYPQAGCSNGDGCTGGGCSACTYCAFTFLVGENTSQCTGQNGTTPFFTATNNGTSALNLDGIFNQTLTDGLAVTYSLTNSTDNETSISNYTDYFRFKQNIAIGEIEEFWFFATIANTTSAGTYSCLLNMSTLCGDGVQQNNEDCDDGNLASGDGCNNICVGECGNGVVDTIAGETCDDGGEVGGDGCDAVCQVECPFYSTFSDRPLIEYMACHPNVESLTLGVLTDDEETLFNDFFVEINNTGYITATPSVDLAAMNIAVCNASVNCWNFGLTAPESSNYFASHMALNVWHDKNETFDWSLEDNFTTTELLGLFGKEDYLVESFSTSTGISAIAYIENYNSPEVYNYINSLGYIKPNVTATLLEIIKDTRGGGTIFDNGPLEPFLHGNALDGNHNFMSHDPLDLLLNLSYEDGGNRLAPNGANAMSDIIAAMSRSVNIPVVITGLGDWFYPLPWNQSIGQSKFKRESVEWFVDGKILIYADDIYGGSRINVTTSSLLMPYQYFTDNYNHSTTCGVINYSCSKGPVEYGQSCLNGSLERSAYGETLKNTMSLANRWCVTSRYKVVESEWGFPSQSTIDIYCDATNEVWIVDGLNYADGYDFLNKSARVHTNNAWWSVANSSEILAANTTFATFC